MCDLNLDIVLAEFVLILALANGCFAVFIVWFGKRVHKQTRNEILAEIRSHYENLPGKDGTT